MPGDFKFGPVWTLQEICSWAASLPAGSTVKVTHHFSSEPTAASRHLPVNLSPAAVKTENNNLLAIAGTAPAKQERDPCPNIFMKESVAPAMDSQDTVGGS